MNLSTIVYFWNIQYTLYKRREIMTLEKFIDIAWLPLLSFCILMYYSIRLLVQGDLSVIKKQKDPSIKDEKMYAKTAGRLILFLAFAAALMTALLFWNVYVALAEIVIFTAVFAFLWSKMNKRFCE